ncbi:MAG: sodium ion-translocating decarboxylase subunit beta [Sulfolobales archaeon]|nr:sodium ion-translocating decarboxylase subunit beta [Sulfolobales archaeon]MDW8083264.1 sodium ion-translocating decarboxylase subunit beta [Sulfolobales archaeon]
MDASMLLPGLIIGDPVELAIRTLFIAWGAILVALAVKKGVEPLLLIPIGLGMILANVPGLHLTRYVCQDLSNEQLPEVVRGIEGLVNVITFENFTRICSPESTSLLGWVYHLVVRSEIGPILIFAGIGALSDFRPLISFPIGALIGSAAQLGITVVTVMALATGFKLNEAMAIGVVGGADGPTTIYTAVNIAPHLVGPLTIAVYSYIALVPVIQPPIIRALVPRKYRAVEMPSPKEVTLEHVLMFWFVCLFVIGALVPAAFPLVVAIAMGNIVKELSTKMGELERYFKTMADPLLDIATMLTMLGVGATLSYDFLAQYVATASPQAFLGFIVKAFTILALGLVAFAVSTVGGLMFSWLLYVVTKGKVNPTIGCAGVSAVPIAARVAQREVQQVKPGLYVLFHALGPNVAGVIGTAVVAGYYISYIKNFWAP